MKLKAAISSLNLTDGEVLTLEKMTDRMEFAALPGMTVAEGDVEICGVKGCAECLNCPSLCSAFTVNPCDCDGPYVYCRPYHN